jgi:hypothetical protein
MNYDEYLSRREWLIATYHLSRDEATEAAYYDTEPETWAGSPWEST